MVNEEIKITVPEGYEIDKENSSFECIKFKKKSLTYDDVAKALFKGKRTNYFTGLGYIMECVMNNEYAIPSNVVTSSQAERIYALNKLINVAEYLNDVWKPNWENRSQQKYIIVFDRSCNELSFMTITNLSYGQVVFKDNESARMAIEILGETEIKKALGVFE